MIKWVICTTSSLILLAVPTASQSATHGINLRLRVPIQCEVTHELINFGLPMGSNRISLGQIKEYCNAPNGYTLLLTYSPGTLTGTQITVGNEKVTLNGSGIATLTNSYGPRIIERDLVATPGESGFNTATIELQIQPN